MQIRANSHSKGLAVLLLALSGLSFVWMGCGKKGPPRPPKRPFPPVVQDLSHTVRGNLVELSWTLPGAGERSAAPPTAVRVFRAVQSAEESDCETCPMRFTAVAEIPIQVDDSEKSESRTLGFTEVIVPGYRYFYKVIVFDEYSIGGKASNLVDFYHQPD